MKVLRTLLLRPLVFLILLSFFLIINYSQVQAYEDEKEKRINLWPLVVYSHYKPKNLTRIEILGPFIYKSKSPEEKNFSFRPFYSSVETFKENKTTEKSSFFLSPLGLYRENEEEIRIKLIPLIDKKFPKDPSVKEGEKWDFFPFFYGRTAQNETYGGIFPIFGTFKDRFGAKEITFFLWPLYSRVSYDNYTTYNVLWPFIRFAKPKSEEDKSFGGYKIWPFYGKFREGEEKRKFILWPFYITYEYKDELGNFHQKKYYFPFYLKEETESYTKKIYLWPFFQVVQGRDPLYCQIDAPWPFYRRITGENIEGKRYWPFYGCVRRPSSLEYFVLWPFYSYREDWYNSTKSSSLEKEYHFLLFSKWYNSFMNGTLVIHEARLWPLFFSYENKSSQTKISYFPALLPFYDEGVERNYAPLLKLSECFAKDNYALTKAIFGFYRQEKFGRREITELAFLLRIVKDETTYYVEILEGLFGFGNIEGKRRIKILYLPFNLTPSSLAQEINNP